MTTLQIAQDTLFNTSASNSVSVLIGYTPLVLLALGLAGILLHNLIQLNRINKSQKGNSSIMDYLKYERYSILISIIMVIIAVITSQEISSLEQVGKKLGLAFISIGYMGQSLLIFLMGKADKLIGKTTDGQN